MSDVFSDAVHSDAGSFFGALYAEDDIRSLLCRAHARRKFEDITKTTKKKGCNNHATSMYAKIYQVKIKNKMEKSSFEEIKAIHQEETIAILNNFK